MSVVLDTNALIWLLKDSYLLGPKAGQRIDEAAREERVMVSAASLWQLAALIAARRLSLGQPLEQWRLDLARIGIEEVAIDGGMAIAAAGLQYVHPGLASRVIAATALREKAVLVTSDSRLLAWKGPVACIDSRV
jgi:PIN domain nuclease of toxin-antitoxin system